MLGDSVTAGHFEWLRDPEEIFSKISEAVLEGKKSNEIFDGPVEVTDAREVYHERFRMKLIDKYEETSVSVINSGIAGDDILGMEKRLSRDVINHQPDLVIVNGSLNWAPERGDVSIFEESLRRVVDRIKAETEADIILMTPNGEGPDPLGLRESTLSKRVEIIRKLLMKKKYVCVMYIVSGWNL